MKTMNVVLIIIGVILVVFTSAMVWLFYTTGAIPDTLVTCVFAACGGEFGVMGWIKTTKDRHQTRKWEIEDRDFNFNIEKDILSDIDTDSTDNLNSINSDF